MLAGSLFATHSFTNYIVKVTEDVLSREYLNVATFDGTNEADVGVIVVPETHLPKNANIVEPDIADLVLENNPDNKKLLVSSK